MKWEQRRLLEMAGLLRRRTPDHLLTEGEDEGGGDDAGGDDLFGDDSGGDDAGGDDLFGDDSGGEEGGEEGAEGGGDETNRIPPKELSATDIEKYGSPRFAEVEDSLVQMFNASFTSASAAAQEMEVYPGSPISDPEEEAGETPAKEEPEDEEANESFYRYGNRRDKWLINEANRLLLEAEDEGAASDEFDMENFARQVANYMENIHNTMAIEGGIFNAARQMILNNFGEDTEKEFVEMLASVDKKWDFTGVKSETEFTAPIAVGGNAAAAGA